MPAIVARSVIARRNSDPPVKIWQIQPWPLPSQSAIKHHKGPCHMSDIFLFFSSPAVLLVLANFKVKHQVIPLPGRLMVPRHPELFNTWCLHAGKTGSKLTHPFAEHVTDQPVYAPNQCKTFPCTFPLQYRTPNLPLLMHLVFDSLIDWLSKA